MFLTTWQPVITCPEGKIMQNEVNFAEKEVKILILDCFLQFECLNMRDIADYDRSNGSGLFYSH